ncbi:hypothetical protein D3C72_1348190 [compost metagenome]
MGSMIQIRQHLTIRHLAHQILEQFTDIGVFPGIPLTEVQLRRYRQITLLRQTTAHILNMFMYAKYLLYHQNDREGAAVVRRFGDIGRQVVTLRRNGGFPGMNALLVGEDGRSRQGGYGRGESPLGLF